MTRRGLVRGLGAALAAVGLGRVLEASGGLAWPPAVRYGAVTIGRHRRLAHRGIYLHVFHRGQDVTNRCRFADDTGDGTAELFKHRDGRPYLDDRTRHAAIETVTGVTMHAGAPPPWMTRPVKAADQ